MNVVCMGLLLFAMSACNNESTKSDNPDQALADSLDKAVDEGHNIGMAKMGKLDKAHAEAQRLIDSIGKLPAKAREAAGPARARLDSLIKDLEYATMAMNKWMEEYNYDSAKNDLSKRIEYLKEEKFKVDKVKVKAEARAMEKVPPQIPAIF